MSPVPPIAHIIGAILGVFVGLTVMDWVAPELESSDPAVTSEAGSGEITASESLLSPAGFATGLSQLREQLAEGQTLETLDVTASSMEAETTDSEDGVDIDEISTSAPYLIAYRIGELRRKPNGSTDVRGGDDLESLHLDPTSGGGSNWTAVLPPELPAPHRYIARIPEASSVAFELIVQPAG
jgi:hypothetical protein